jgi:predicted RNA-binding protein with PUA-like domain
MAVRAHQGRNLGMERYWLMKSEPSAYSIDDLERDGSTSWEGVRNFQARNHLREMKKGDGVLFYASSADPTGVAGIARISREAYPDPFATDRGHRYFDPKSDPAKPTWYAVDLEFVEKLPRVVTLAELRQEERLASMQVLRRGNRLSVQPVTKEEFEIVREMAARG